MISRPAHLLVPFLLLCFASCGGKPSDSEPQQSFDEVFEQAKGSVAEKLAALQDKIEKTTAKHRLHLRKPESVSDTAKGATFDFENDNALFIYWNGSSYPEEQRHRYFDQHTLHTLGEAFAAAPAEFRPSSKEPQRIKSLEQLVENVEALSKNVEYLFFLYGPLTDIPSFRGSSFIPGVYNGTLLVFELGNPDPIAIKKVAAKSSTSVSYKRGKLDEAIKNIRTDYRRNVDSAIGEVVKSIATVKGYVPSLPASFPMR